MRASTSSTFARFACLALSVAAGLYLGVFWARLGDETPRPIASERRTPSKLTATSVGQVRAKATPLQEAIEQEHRLSGIDPSEFRALLEAELSDATDSGPVFRMAEVWAERDPDGFHAWIHQRSGNFTLKEAGFGVGLTDTLLSILIRDDPEKAWEIAGDLPGRKDAHRVALLSKVMIQNPDRAIELVRSHRDEISVSDPGWGRWGHVDPATTLPIINELLPGRCREAMVRDAASYYLEHPETLEDSKAWFEKLPPEIQKQALGFTKNSLLGGASHTVLTRLQDAWGEIRDAGSSQ